MSGLGIGCEASELTRATRGCVRRARCVEGGVRGYERKLYERVREEVRSAVVGVDAGGL